MVRWCWVNFQFRGVLLIWIRVGQGPPARAVGAGGYCSDIFFSRLSFLFSFSLSLGDGPIWTVEGPLSPKQPRLCVISLISIFPPFPFGVKVIIFFSSTLIPTWPF